MAVERVDYYSDEEYQMALESQEEQERQWIDEQHAIAEEAERQHIEDNTTK